MTAQKLGVVVLASAGTGKTFRLTNRLIGLLASGQVEPSGLLATTFTRKAAGEIAQRVLARLCAGATTEEGLASLRDHVDESLTHERCRALLVGLLSSMHELNVQTIDSFFAKLASGFALELGVPPGWRIIDEDEDDALREEAIGLALERADRKELSRFIAMLHQGEASRRVRSRLSEVIRDVYPAYLQTIGRNECWEVVRPTGNAMSAADRDSALRVIEALEVPTTQAGKPRKRWSDALAFINQAALAEDWDWFIGQTLVQRVLDGDGAEFDRVPIPESFQAAISPLIEHARYQIIDALLMQNIATRNLLKQFDDAYQSLKRSTRGYRFEDLPRMLLEAEATGSLEELYFRLDARLRHVLLDEFQDTSVTQFRLLEPILDELLSQGEGERGVFCVGDVKQSLYGWREAEPELLVSLPERWTTLDVEQLHTSYRSSQVVLDAVNDALSSANELPMFADEPFPVNWTGGYIEHHAAKELAGQVRLWCGPAKEEDGTPTDQRFAHIAFAARRVADIAERAPNATIGVLFRTGRDIPRLIHELRELGVEASAEGGSTLDDAPSVASALSMIHLADHPGDSQSAYHVAHGPLGAAIGLTNPFDEQQVARVARDLRTRLSREGYAGVLADLHQRGAAGMDERGFQRFGQLAELGETFDARGGTRSGEFLALVQSKRVEEPSPRPVRVMTIHASKGLEFDAVVLPELGRSWSVKAGNVMIDRPSVGEPVRAVSVYAKQAIRPLNGTLAAISEQETRRRIEEELCVLYVAMTRARFALEMIVPHTKNESKALNAGRLLTEALAPSVELAPESVLWESGSADWTGAIEPKAESASDAPAVPLRLAPGTPSRSSVRTASPSAMEGGGVVRLADRLRLSPTRSLQRGDLLHAWFQRVAWIEDGTPTDDELLEIARTLGWSDADARAQIGEFRRALDGEIGRALSKCRYEGDVDLRQEWRFSYIDRSGDEPVQITGQFDRLVIGREGPRATWAEILDFKTDRIPSEDPTALDARVGFYAPQIDAYRRAAGSMFKLPEARIRAFLCFTAVGRVVEVEPDGSVKRTESS